MSATATLETPAAIHWPLNVDACMQPRYRQQDPALDALYAKAKASQWNIEDLDWAHELDPDNPLSLPDSTLPMWGTTFWNRLSPQAQAEARRHFQAWTLSQILHGEQAALLCATKLAQGESGLSARLCAAAQAYDEARHVEAYARLVDDKVGIAYPMSTSLRLLLQDTVSARELDITNLGMQILVEGIALSMFQTVAAYTRDPFVKQLLTRIQRDEARHFAVGNITLRRLYTTELSEPELAQRETFLCEGIAILYEHLCADDVWEPLGHSRAHCAELVRGSELANGLRRNLFRRLVPAVRSMGLARPRVLRLLESLGLSQYMAWPMPVDAL